MAAATPKSPRSSEGGRGSGHSGGHGGGHGGGHSGGMMAHHLVPFGVLFRVWGSLLVLTVVTVLASYIDLGTVNTLVAMIIATVKALLVLLFFMGMKYEGQENIVAFGVSAVFLVIFVSLTTSDLLYRRDTDPLHVDRSELRAFGPPADPEKFIQPAGPLLAKGKELFTAQCVSCHGAEGRGDGPASVSLTPKPRNFTASEGWKNGRGLAPVFKTVTNGIPGSGMPAFSTLSVEERFALAHFVRTLMVNPPGPEAGELQALKDELAAANRPRLSVAEAMKKLAAEWAASEGSRSR